MIAITTPLIFIPPTSIWSLVGLAGLTLVVTGYLFAAHYRVYAMPLLERIFIGSVLLLSLPVAAIVFTALLVLLAVLLS